MAIAKPRLFIGSSAESLPIAHVLQDQLQLDAEVQVWNQGIFGIADYTLDSLLKATKEFDFAAFVFGADDTLKSRGKRYLTARDNVVLELGLFAGRLGRKRTYIVLQRTTDPLHLPSDLQGITPAVFDWPEDQKFDFNKLPTVIAASAMAIRVAMHATGVTEDAIKPLSGGMVFLALLLRERSFTLDKLSQPFRQFQTIADRIPEGDAGMVYSAKAAKYACQCLEALGMAESFGGNEYALTKLGEELLRSEKLQARHKPTFAVFKKLRGMLLK